MGVGGLDGPESVPPPLKTSWRRHCPAESRLGTTMSDRLCHLYELFKTNNIEILCITETWLAACIDDGYLLFPGYYCVFRRERETRGGGICVMYRDSLQPVELDIPTTGSHLETL